MKIVVLDGQSANPGDLSWDGLSAYGAVTVYPQTRPEDLLERARGAEVLLTNKVLLLEEQVQQLPSLKYIGVLATGFNVVGLEACRSRGIVVTNIPGYSSHSVCQMTFALLLGLCHQLLHHDAKVRDRSWSRSGEPCFIDRPLVEIAGLQLGLVGFGQIAREVARVALAFGLNLQVFTAHPQRYQQDWPGVRFVELDELCTSSDMISLHCPLNEQTHHLVDADFLAQMKSQALLINTGRGLLVDEQAVADCLHSGKLGGYGADVLGTEPPPEDHPLLDAPNTLLTSHIAWGTRAARQRLIDIAVDNLGSFVEGKERNRIV